MVAALVSTLSAVTRMPPIVIDPPISVDSFSISGTVYTDPRPSEMVSRPIAGCTVYLSDQIYYLMADGAAPYAPIATIDSVITEADGNYSFDKQPVGSYQISFNHSDYTALALPVYLQVDTMINVQLLPAGAKAAVSGNVSYYVPPRPGLVGLAAPQPLPNCSVWVYTGSNGGIMPYAAEQRLIAIYQPLYLAVTDALGNYSIDSILIDQYEQAFTASVYKDGYVGKSIDSTLVYASTTVINFMLEKSYVNVDSNRVNNVVYKLTTEKTAYATGEYIYATYSVTNKSNGDKTFNFSSGCQYDYLIQDKAGAKVYQHSDLLDCARMATSFTLKPDSSKSYAVSYSVPATLADSLKLTMRLLGTSYANSAVTIPALITQTTAVVPHASIKTGSLSGLSITMKNGQMIMKNSVAQRITIEAFQLNGRSTVLASGFYAAGNHALVSSTPLSGMVIIRARSEQGSTVKRFMVGK